MIKKLIITFIALTFSFTSYALFPPVETETKGLSKNIIRRIQFPEGSVPSLGSGTTIVNQNSRNNFAQRKNQQTNNAPELRTADTIQSPPEQKTGTPPSSSIRRNKPKLKKQPTVKKTNYEEYQKCISSGKNIMQCMEYLGV